jgi:hypothetical protein
MDSQFRHHKMTDRRQSTANLTTLVILSEAKAYAFSMESPRQWVPHPSALFALGWEAMQPAAKLESTASAMTKKNTTCHPERSIRIREANSDAESKDPFHLSISNRPG